MCNQPKNQSQALNWLKFPLAVLVVYIHTHSRFISYTSATDEASAQLLYKMILAITHLAVPTFFIISGYFFTKGCDDVGIHYDSVFGGKLRKRVRTLLIPFLLWNTIIAICAFARKYFAHDLSDLHSLVEIYWGNTAGWLDQRNYLGLPSKSYVYPLDVPLWFVRDLMVSMLFAPILSWLALKLKRYYLIITTLLLVLGVTPIIAGYRTSTLYWFGFGFYFGIHGKLLIDGCARMKWPCLIIALLLWYPRVIQESLPVLLSELCCNGFLVAGCVTMINLAVAVTRKQCLAVPATLQQSVFFVYSFHCFILFHPLIKAPLAIIPHNFFTLALYLVVMPLVIVALSVAAYAISKRLLPHFTALLTGNRC